MPELLKPKVRQAEEALRDLPVAVGEAVLESSELERSEARDDSSTGSARRPLTSAEVVEAAHRVAKDIYGCWEFAERLEVYRSVGERFKGRRPPGPQHRRRSLARADLLGQRPARVEGAAFRRSELAR